MTPSKILIRLVPIIAISLTAYAKKSEPLEVAGVTCQIPPPLHCPDADCPGKLVTEEGSAIEPKTGREFFLDYPCNLKKGEKVTFILSLHGFGSYGNWTRHYFPLMDYKDKYRLVIATPNAVAPPPKAWTPVDDEYLQNIVNLVYEKFGKENIKAFWLVGHSQGGMTSNRIIRTDFFKQRVDGWLSLSGGRLGANPGRGNFSNLTTGRGAAPATAATATSSDARGTGAVPAASTSPPPQPHCASLRPTSSPSSMRPARMKWTVKGYPKHRSGRRSSDAGRVFESRMWSIRRRATSMIPPVRILVRTPGAGFRVRARPRFSNIRIAVVGELWPMSFVKARVTPRGSSRT